jgi:hypothetical protein
VVLGLAGVSSSSLVRHYSDWSIRVNDLLSDGARGAARVLTAEGIYFAMRTIHEPQLRLHVAVAGSIDHRGVARQSAVSQDCCGRLVVGLVVFAVLTPGCELS